MSERILHSSYYLVLLIIVILFASCETKRKTSWKITFDRNSKQPYGCYIAYHHLNRIYPNATIKPTKHVMKHIKAIASSKNNYTSKNHALIVVANNFYMDSLEMSLLKKYVSRGNTVCLIAADVSENILEYAGVQDNYINNIDNSTARDTTTQELNLLFNGVYSTYHYRGMELKSYLMPDSTFDKFSSTLGYLKHDTMQNLLCRHDSLGTFVFGCHPITLSNHFLLQHNNIEYYEKLFSYLHKSPNTVTWASYISKYQGELIPDNPFSMIFRKPPLLYAFLITMLALLLYTFFASKRRQRIIPVQEPIANTSLEFAEAVGMMYRQQNNLHDLAQKMIRHHLQHLRTKHKANYNVLDDAFTHQLAGKLQAPTHEVSLFVKHLNYLIDSPNTTEQDIKYLYQQIKKYS